MLCVIAPVLVAAQITLGVLVVLSLRAVPIAVGHFAGAASLWALWMSAWLMTARRQKAIDVEGELSRRSRTVTAQVLRAKAIDIVALVKPHIMVMSLLTAAGAMSLAPGTVQLVDRARAARRHRA